MGNIMKKKESDERFEITRLTEKALAKHNRSKRRETYNSDKDQSYKCFSSSGSMISLTTNTTSLI